MNKFDIVLIKFPFTDLNNCKLRPALVVTEPKGENLILCQITTKKRNISDFEIKLNKKNCSGEIRFDSNIYVDLIFALHKSIIIKKLGKIENKGVTDEVQKKLGKLFT